jgi:hypothetical protein
MPIRTGIGVGEAQIYDTSGIVNTYIRSLELAEKRNQKKLEMLADITKDIPETIGTRKVDEPVFKELYSGIKDLNRQAQSLVGTKGYTEAVADVESKVKAYKEAVYRSKKQSEAELNGARFLAQNVGFVEENDIKKFNERKNTPILNLVDDYDVASSILIPKTNKRKDVEATLMGREGEQYAKLDLSATENIGGGAKQYYKVIKPDDAITIIKEKLLDPEYRRLAYYEYKQKNPEATEVNDDIVAKNEYNILAPNGAIKIKSHVVTPSTSSNKPDKLSSTELFALNTKGSFGGNEKAKKMIINSSRGNILDIKKNADGTVTIYPAAEIKIFDFDGRQIGSKKSPKKEIIVSDVNKYFNELKQLQVSASDMSVLNEMGTIGGGSPKPNPEPEQKTEYIKFILNGDEYEIPSNMAAKFQKENPKAKRK